MILFLILLLCLVSYEFPWNFVIKIFQLYSTHPLLFSLTLTTTVLYNPSPWWLSTFLDGLLASIYSLVFWVLAVTFIFLNANMMMAAKSLPLPSVTELFYFPLLNYMALSKTLHKLASDSLFSFQLHYLPPDLCRVPPLLKYSVNQMPCDTSFSWLHMMVFLPSIHGIHRASEKDKAKNRNKRCPYLYRKLD